MEQSLRNTRTEQNLLKAFAGESQARNRYTYFAKQAMKEGYEQIAAIFLETAEQERMHAKRMFEHLEGGMVSITAAYPAGVIGTTLENLKEAAAGEHEEAFELYPAFAETADHEGFPHIAEMYRRIIVAEQAHEKRYQRLMMNIEREQVFTREHEVTWQCRKCGYIHRGKEAPKKCPACQHSQAYFQLEEENF
jgi:rubrerythrin